MNWVFHPSHINDSCGPPFPHKHPTELVLQLLLQLLLHFINFFTRAKEVALRTVQKYRTASHIVV